MRRGGAPRRGRDAGRNPGTDAGPRPAGPCQADRLAGPGEGGFARSRQGDRSVWRRGPAVNRDRMARGTAHMRFLSRTVLPLGLACVVASASPGSAAAQVAVKGLSAKAEVLIDRW